jgi:hypothetical protein
MVFYKLLRLSAVRSKPLTENCTATSRPDFRRLFGALPADFFGVARERDLGESHAVA